MPPSREAKDALLTDLRPARTALWYGPTSARTVAEPRFAPRPDDRVGDDRSNARLVESPKIGREKARIEPNAAQGGAILR